ncbi:MAG: LD-carboxypeptidase [Chitinophagaceae bacterium]|nr:LD-carboxypeptidase [Chitinophagaceae bacterium]
MNKSTMPPYLKAGDTIGITCPAGALPLTAIDDMCRQLSAWGFKTVIGKTVGTSFHKFSATDDERLQDLQSMLDDDSIQAVLFGRGGYGLVRIIDHIDFTSFQSKPKWLLGFSDITCLLSHVHSNYHIATIHGHMSGGYQPGQHDATSTQSIYDALTGKSAMYQLPQYAMNRPGHASGELVGGNLALLSDLIGTPSDIDTTHKILFIEDIGEYLYSVDRMMWQLKRAGKLTHLKALLVGGFTGSLDNDTPFGMTDNEIIFEKIKDYDYPVYFDVPVGHQPLNISLKIGAEYSIDQNTLTEIFPL